MDNQYRLVRNTFGNIIDVIYRSSLDRAKWIKEHYRDYYPFGLSFERCAPETAQKISDELKQQGEDRKRLSKLLNLN